MSPTPLHLLRLPLRLQHSPPSSLLLTAGPFRQQRAFRDTPSRALSRMQLIGRLADKPELQATSTGVEVVRYAVGTTTGRGDNARTSWFRVSAFLREGAQRDFICGLGKGSLVFVDCDASMTTYQDSEGKTRSSMNIVQQKLDVLASKREEGSESE